MDELFKQFLHNLYSRIAFVCESMAESFKAFWVDLGNPEVKGKKKSRCFGEFSKKKKKNSADEKQL